MDLCGLGARQPAERRRCTRRVRLVVTAVVLASGIWLAVRNDLLGSLAALRHFDPLMLAVASLATVTAVVNRGFLHHESRRLHGVASPLRTEIRMSAAALAINKVVQSGGLAGLAFYLRCGRREDAPVAAVTRAFVVVGAAAQVALAVLAIAAVAIVPRDELPLGGALSDMVVGSVGVGAFLVVTGVFLAGVMTSGSARGVGQLVAGATRIVLHAGVNKLLGACTLAAVLDAAGAPVGLETVIVVYATALVSAALSLIPGGIGVVEASTVAVLTASGMEPGTALAAVLAFRLFDLWIPVFVGWALARRLEFDGEAPEAESARVEIDPPVVVVAETGGPVPVLLPAVVAP